MPSAYVGIDLGTTYSGVVVAANGETRIVRDSITGSVKFPSALYYPKGESSPLVGQPAISEAVLDDRVQYLLQEFKRGMGSAKQFPISEIGKITAEDASAEIIKHCRRMALERLPATAPEDINWAISVPAKFDLRAKESTLAAGIKAGISKSKLSLVLEPEAAAITAYLNRRLDLQDGQSLIVFDFGGGTLDIVVMQKKSNGLEPLVVEGGDARLGGRDLDRELAAYMVDRLRERRVPGGPIPPFASWAAAEHFHIMQEVERVKRFLCGQRGAGGGRRQKLNLQYGDRLFLQEIDIQQFSTVASAFNSKARDALRHTLNLATERGVHVGSIGWVILTGGTSQVLGIEKVVRDVVGPGPRISMPDDPWESIAFGACSFAADPKIILSKISGDAYGISCSRDATLADPKDRVFVTSYGARKCNSNSLFFFKGQKVGQEGVTHSFWTVEDNQVLVTFPILRGDSEDPSKCETLGKLKLKIPRRPRGYPMRCNFKIDVGNRLLVAVWDPETNERAAAHVDWVPAPLV